MIRPGTGTGGPPALDQTLVDRGIAPRNLLVFTSKMKRRHAGAIGRPGGSGAAPRARQRYAICNDGDTQGTLKSASLEPFCFVVQQTEARMKGKDERKEEQRHKQTNSGQCLCRAEQGVGWGVCPSWMRYMYVSRCLVAADDGTANRSPNGSNVAGSHKSPERAIKAT